MRLTLFLTAVLLLATVPASAQAQSVPERQFDPNRHAWLMLFSDARLAGRWGLHTEFQWRRARLGRSPQQELYRAGLNYHASDRVMLTAGYAFVQTYRYGEFPAADEFPEHRLYEQLLLRDKHGALALSHRYRLEQRWIRFPNTADYTFLNRFRYMLRGALPLLPGRTAIDPGTPYLAVYDELFIGFGENVIRNVFDQNRAYGALGWQLTKALSVEAGYLHQLVLQRNGRIYESNHTLQLGLTFNPDYRPTPQP